MAVEELKLEFDPFPAFTVLSPDVAVPPPPTVTEYEVPLIKEPVVEM
jgi:hypothetical protein